jgi:hypothetical protein
MVFAAHPAGMPLLAPVTGLVNALPPVAWKLSFYSMVEQKCGAESYGTATVVLRRIFASKVRPKESQSHKQFKNILTRLKDLHTKTAQNT